MASFSVTGPFDIVPAQLHAARHISSSEGKAFFKAHPSIAKERGCYVFGFRAGKGFKPIYVGKATKSFFQEIFTEHKLNKYNHGLASQKKGTPVFFFVCLGKTKGPVNKVAIDEAELFLIQAGLVANKSPLNSHKTAVESWSIAGVVRSGVGKRSKPAIALCKCLKL